MTKFTCFQSWTKFGQNYILKVKGLKTYW